MEYTVFDRGAAVGSASAERRGLYWHIAAECRMETERIVRLYAHDGEKNVRLGVLMPEGGALRLYLRPLPKLTDKSALIEHVLTAPAAEIFCFGIPHVPFPAAPQRRDERQCAVCGELTREDFLQIRGGVPVCTDCAEK